MGGEPGNFLFDAQGDIFSRGSIVPFARGDIFNRPTFFPFAQGIGVLGEAGPEAIMPLARTRGGDLGVQVAAGGGKTELVFHILNNTSAPIGKATGRQISDREFLIELDEINAQLVQSGGKMASAISEMTGTRPPATVR